MPIKDLSISERNILRMRLVGKECAIEYAGNTFAGVIKNETKSTWQLSTRSGLKTLPKNQSKLIINIEETKYKIDGNRLIGRHEDRIKARMKRKW
jgi:RNase P/RNase MRP subunit p29